MAAVDTAPSFADFLEEVGPLNPSRTTAQIRDMYQRRFGAPAGATATTSESPTQESAVSPGRPSFTQFLSDVGPLNPSKNTAQIRDMYVKRFGHEAPEPPEPPESTGSYALRKMVEPFTEFGKGYTRGVPKFYDWMADQTARLAKLAPQHSATLQEGADLFRRAADLTRGQAEGKAPDANIIGRVFGDLGEWVSAEGAKMTAFTSALGPVAGLAALGAVEESGRPGATALSTVVEATKNALLGGELKAASGLGLAARTASGGAAFAGQAAAAGERNPEKLAEAGLSGAVFTAPGAIRGTPLREAVSSELPGAAKPVPVVPRGTPATSMAGVTDRIMTARDLGDAISKANETVEQAASPEAEAVKAGAAAQIQTERGRLQQMAGALRWTQLQAEANAREAVAKGEALPTKADLAALGRAPERRPGEPTAVIEGRAPEQGPRRPVEVVTPPRPLAARAEAVSPEEVRDEAARQAIELERARLRLGLRGQPEAPPEEPGEAGAAVPREPTGPLPTAREAAARRMAERLPEPDVTAPETVVRPEEAERPVATSPQVGTPEVAPATARTREGIAASVQSYIDRQPEAMRGYFEAKAQGFAPEALADFAGQPVPVRVLRWADRTTAIVETPSREPQLLQDAPRRLTPLPGQPEATVPRYAPPRATGSGEADPMITQPRDRLPAAQSEHLATRAEVARDLVTQGEPGRRVFTEAETGGAPEVRGVASTYPDFYGPLAVKATKRLSKKQRVLEALDKIVKDQGEDVGPVVEKVKRAILEDRSLDEAAGERPQPAEGTAAQEPPPGYRHGAPGTWHVELPAGQQIEFGDRAGAEWYAKGQPGAKVLEGPAQPTEEWRPPERAAGTQTELPVGAPEIGQRPLIGREPTPEEAPLFSKAAQTPEEEQLRLEERQAPYGPRLSVLHNLTEENLAHAEKLGGLAVPSLGVVPEHMGITGMGGITMIGRRALAEPREVPVHDADVYSPTFPKAEYDKVRSSIAQAVVDRLRPFADRFGDQGPKEAVWENAVNRPDPEEITRQWLRSNAVQAMYLQEHGVSVAPVMREKKIPFNWAKYLDYDAYRRAMPYEDTRPDVEQEAGREHARRLITRAVDEYLSRDQQGQRMAGAMGREEARELAVSFFGSNGDWLTKGEPMPGTMDWKIEQSVSGLGQLEVNEAATEKRLHRALAGHEADFTRWVHDQVLGMFGRPFVRIAGRKYPYTLDNIVDAMKGRVRAREGTMTFGEGKARAAASRRFQDLEQMRRGAGNIADETTINAAREDAKAKMEQYRSDVVPFYGETRGEGYSEFARTWDGLDASMRAMSRWAKGAKTAERMRYALSAEGFRTREMPADLLDQAVEAGKAWLRAPVPYFEAKPQRAVRLNEFAGAVVPSTASAQTREILERHGIPYREYDATKRGAQQGATVAFRNELARHEPDVLFERGAEYEGLTDSQRLYENSPRRALRPDADADRSRQLTLDALGDLDRAAGDVSSAGGVLSRPERVPGEGSGVRTRALGFTPELIRTGRLDLRGQTIRSAEDLAGLAQVVRDPRFETFRIFYTKGDRIVGHEAVTSRLPGVTEAFVGSGQHLRALMAMKDRMRRLDADGYYLLHNHPSGNPEPSMPDVAVTDLYRRYVRGFRGHVVVDSGTWGWIDAGGNRQPVQPLREAAGPDALLTASLPHADLGQQLTSAERVAAIGASLKTPEGFVTLLYQANMGGLRAIQEMPLALFQRPKDAGDFIRGRAREFGGSQVFAYYPGRDAQALAAGRDLIRSGHLLDYVYATGLGIRRDVLPAPKPGTPLIEQTPYFGKNVRELRGARAGEPAIEEAAPYETETQAAEHPEAPFSRTDQSLIQRVIRAGTQAMKELKEAYSRPPTVTESKKSIGRYTGTLQAVDYELSQLGKAINETFPKDRQEAITNYIQAGGDQATLAERARAVPDAYRQGYLDAMHLTPEEQKAAKWFHARMEALFEQASAAGVIEQHVEHYVRQEWERPEQAARSVLAQANAGVFQLKPREALHRVFQNYAEGEQAGYVPKDKSIGYQVVAAERSVRQAIAARLALRELMGSREADGRPTVMVGVGGTITQERPVDFEKKQAFYVKPNVRPEYGDLADYRYLNHPALRKWQWIDSTSGKSMMREGNMWIHPDAYGRLYALLGRSRVAEYTIPESVPIIGGTQPGRAALQAGAFVKGTILIGPFHQFHMAEHAIFHEVDPFTTRPIDFDSRPVLREGVDHGLMLYNHNAMREFGEGLASGGLFHRLPIVGDYLQRYQEWLFQDYIPRLKAEMFEAAVTRAERYYEADLKDGRLTRDQLLDNVAKQANAAFGEQNYKYMGRNPTVQDALRLALLAPDFLEARLRFAGQALRPYGKEQAMALLRGAIIMGVTAQLTNLMFGDDHKAHWDKPFTITVGGYDYSPRSVVGDMAHLIQDPRGFWYHRLNPLWGRPLLEMAAGRDRNGQQVTVTEAAKDIAKSWTPIPGQGFFKRNLGETPLQSVMNGVLQSVGVSNWASKTDAERLIADINFGHRRIAHELPLEQRRHEVFRDLLDEYRSGTMPMADIMKEAKAQGVQLTRDQVKQLQLSRVQTPEADTLRLKHRMRSFSAEEMLKVWDVMNPDEKQRLGSFVAAKVYTSRTLPLEQKQAFMQAWRAYRREHAEAVNR